MTGSPCRPRSSTPRSAAAGSPDGAQIAGFAAGGVLVSAVGPGWAIGIDALTFALAAICYSLLRVPHTRAEGARPSFLGDLGDGLREVFRHTWLWLLIGQALLYHLFYGGAQGVLGPIVVEDTIGRTAWGVALGRTDGRVPGRRAGLPALAAAARALRRHGVPVD